MGIFKPMRIFKVSAVYLHNSGNHFNGIGRAAAKIGISEDDNFRFALAFRGMDEHNHVIENAILDYRFEFFPFTEKDIDLSHVKEILFSGIYKKYHESLHLSYVTDKVWSDFIIYLLNSPSYENIKEIVEEKEREEDHLFAKALFYRNLYTGRELRNNSVVQRMYTLSESSFQKKKPVFYPKDVLQEIDEIRKKVKESAEKGTVVFKQPRYEFI